MNKWVRRLIKMTISFFLVVIIAGTGGYFNRHHELSATPLPLFVIYLVFQIPYLVCYSSWANKKFWKRNNSQNN